MKLYIHILYAIILLVPLNNLFGQEQEVGIVEKLDQYIPQDVILTSEEGQKVLIDSLIDKPTVFSFVYFRCPGICTPLMDGISEVIEKSAMKIGKDYQVFTISFDASEGPSVSSRKKSNYLSHMESKGASEGWQFFTGDSANISKLTRATGFKYKRAGNEFLHAAALIIVSPEGKITRYLNGTYFLPFELKMSIIEASEGKSGPTINRVLQYCYSYDPAGQKYVLNITKVTGALIIFIALLFFMILGIKSRFSKKSALSKG